MGWRDELLDASFRGAPFSYREVKREGGRRLAKFEYPKRDTNFLEDMGRKAGVYHVQGWVLGDDYFSARDALEAALNAEGSATLVHPYKGNLTVGCDSYSIAEIIDEGRMARFEMVFIEDGAQPSPTAVTDTAGAAYSASQNQQSAIGAGFSGIYSLAHLDKFIQAELTAVIGGFVDDAALLAGAVQGDLGFVSSLLAAINGASGNPAALGPAVAGFFGAYADAMVPGLPASDPATSSRGAQPAADQSYGLAAFATWGSDLAPVMGLTPQRLQQAVNQAAFISLVQGGAITALAQLYANTDFVSANDAEAARDQLAGFIDDQALAAGDIGDDLAYAGWMTLYSVSVIDLTTRAQGLPNILYLTFASSMAALWLAQRIYQDGSRAPELISRNAAPHPLFMPLAIEALAS